MVPAVVQVHVGKLLAEEGIDAWHLHILQPYKRFLLDGLYPRLLEIETSLAMAVCN